MPGSRYVKIGEECNRLDDELRATENNEEVIRILLEDCSDEAVAFFEKEVHEMVRVFRAHYFEAHGVAPTWSNLIGFGMMQGLVLARAMQRRGMF